MENWSAHQLYSSAEAQLGSDTASELVRYAKKLQSKNFPVIFSLNHLAKIVEIPYPILHNTVRRLRESCNYKMFAIRKRSGGRRFIHVATKKLNIAQDFINSEILKLIEPHPACYSFHKKGGIRKCAEQHCSAKWLFQFDLKDFFYNINEFDVYNIFHKAGYKKILSFEMARLCTTTRIPKDAQNYISLTPFEGHTSGTGMKYKYPNKSLGVLPQGAATSPMLSNLAAYSLDEDLIEYALINNMVYTRYADDITFSATVLKKGLSIGKLKREILQLIHKNHFIENKNKIHMAGPGSRKIVLGLLVDGSSPRLSHMMVKRIEQKLYASNKFGITEAATHYDFESALGFYNHLRGLVAYVKDVDSERWDKFSPILKSLKCPWDRF